MRIGFDAKRLFCNFTGLGNYSRTLVRNLSLYQPSNDYFLYSPKANNHPQTKPFFNSQFFNVFLPKVWFKSFWRSYSILKQLHKDQIELYHGLSHELPFSISKSKIKTVVTIHDLIFKTQPETYSWINRKIYNWKFQYSCKHADKIIAISQNTKADIMRFYAIPSHKIEVIYQACQPLYYQLNQSPKQDAILKQYKIPNQYILSVGTIQARKNLKLLIKAYQYLPTALQLPIVVVGNGKQYKTEVLALIKAMQLEHLVIWIHDLKADDELQTIYQNAELLVYPSFYEGFGLPVVEALLSKTPVITAQTSALKEAGGPNSIYIDPIDDRGLAQAIKTVLNNPDLANSMREKGYQYAHQMFHPQKLSKQLADCYQQLLRP
ncbi:glycosyltransferase family 4 protein [Aureispira anguillae]|uniref:Glycosyltransferase family 4 protein n=1 Tax=Aureispira anguillae TaxID=2864201 RepID=A0A916DTG9_9BACT|nr:glycosyltransferase family 1 protein [Aureispira anguillae]BDS12546.1 glycosyltransferase family 4 protein [Aureispira anguillae]